MYTFVRSVEPLSQSDVLDVSRDGVIVAQFIQSRRFGAPVRMAVTSDGGKSWWGHGLAGHPDLDAVQRSYQSI